MATATRKAAVVVAAVAAWIGTGTAIEGSGEVPPVVLHVSPVVEVPAHVLADAQEIAVQTYARIGVRLVWTGGLARAAAADGALHLDVILLGESAANGRNANRMVFGQAGRATRRAYIYYTRIAEHARLSGSDPARVLALVLAHEVGHMLLPEHSHAASGLMQGHWAGRITKVPDFHPAQAEVIRRLLTGVVAAN